MPYQFLADTVLVIHFAVVAFVVGGLAVVMVGNGLEWRWVNAMAFRVIHLAAIAFIAVQAWLGLYCPLTYLESWLRVQAGQSAYAASFIEHWLQRILYVQAPLWVFAVLYTAFALLVLLAWRWYPPRRHRRYTRDA